MRGGGGGGFGCCITPQRRNRRPAADTITDVCSMSTRAHVGFARRLGRRASPGHACCMSPSSHARTRWKAACRFAGSSRTLQVRDSAAGQRRPKRRFSKEGSDGVRLMTVHKAKGLEFPVVILADITCRHEPQRCEPIPGRAAGSVRVEDWRMGAARAPSNTKPRKWRATRQKAFVSPTSPRRARAICWSCLRLATTRGTADGSAPLNRALYPPVASRRNASARAEVSGFQVEDSVAAASGRMSRPGMATVCPGLHTFPEGYSVVWWEPGAGGMLTLGAKAPFGIRREELIVKDVPRNVIADGRAEYDRWRLARAGARESGAMPSVMLATAREWAAGESGPAADLETPLPEVW